MHFITRYAENPNPSNYVNKYWITSFSQPQHVEIWQLLSLYATAKVYFLSNVINITGCNTYIVLSRRIITAMWDPSARMIVTPWWSCDHGFKARRDGGGEGTSQKAWKALISLLVSSWISSGPWRWSNTTRKRRTEPHCWLCCVKSVGKSTTADSACCLL